MLQVSPNRFVVFAVTLLLLNVIVLSVGAAVVLAAPPLQDPGVVPGTDPLMAMLALLYSAIVGGAWRYFLDSFPSWKTWDPEKNGLPAWTKRILVLAFSGASIFLIVAAREWLTANMPQLAPWLQTALFAVAAWVVSQVLYEFRPSPSPALRSAQEERERALQQYSELWKGKSY